MSRSSIVESIKSKINRIINENIKIRGKYEDILAREVKLKEANRMLQESVISLQKRIGILELREGFAVGSEDKRLAKARVNRLMREIDKCIAMMNN